MQIFQLTNYLSYKYMYYFRNVILETSTVGQKTKFIPKLIWVRNIKKKNVVFKYVRVYNKFLLIYLVKHVYVTYLWYKSQRL